MKSVRWITVLVFMFMFQSVWNVAAAFCIHEQQSQKSHFGHHQSQLCMNKYSSESFKEKNDHSHTSSPLSISDSANYSIDHQDHLPSMSQVILSFAQVLNEPTLTESFHTNQFYWSNRYRSPHLGQVSPPPQSSPL